MLRLLEPALDASFVTTHKGTASYVTDLKERPHALPRADLFSPEEPGMFLDLRLGIRLIPHHSILLQHARPLDPSYVSVSPLFFRKRVQPGPGGLPGAPSWLLIPGLLGAGRFSTISM